MSDTVEIPIPGFTDNGAVAKTQKRAAKIAVPDVTATAPRSAVGLESLSLNSALAEIESARVPKSGPRTPAARNKRPLPKYVRKRP